MIGRELQSEMSDDTTQWLPLKDVLESNPVETAEYAVATRLVKETCIFMVGLTHTVQVRSHH